jgi:hypothetical protein
MKSGKLKEIVGKCLPLIRYMIFTGARRKHSRY